MAKDLELNVRGDSKSAAAALAAAAHEMDKAAKEADNLGRAFDAAKRDAEQLDRELLKNAAAVKLLAKEYSSAEGEIRDGIKERLDAERAAGNELRKVRKDLVGDTERDSNAATAVLAAALKERSRLAAKAAQEDKSARERVAKEFKKLAFDTGSSGASGLASALGNELKAAFESGAPEVKVAIANVVGTAAIGVAAPVGAAINGAILAGIGLGGIGLGIAGQLSNPAVQAAGKQLGKDLKNELTSATSGFADPIVAAAQIIDISIGRTIGGLEDDLDGLAAHLEPLARGIGGLFEHAFGGKGFADALEKAGPIVDDLAQNLPELGDSLDRFFKLMADGSDGAKDGLDLLFLATETLIVGIGGLIDGLSKLYHWFLAPGREIKSWWDDLRGNTQATAQRLDDFSVSAQSAAEAIEGTAKASASSDAELQKLGSTLDFTAGSVDKLAANLTEQIFNAIMGVDQATLGWQESLTRLGQSFEQNGKQLDIHTSKGQANREAVLSAVRANEEYYQAQVLSGTSASVAAGDYDKNTAALEAQLRKAHLTQGEIDGLIGKYRNVPDDVNTNIALQGLTDALRGLEDVERAIHGLPSRKDIYIYEHHSGIVGGKEGPGKYAAGGPVMKGQPVIVGDGGQPELFVPNANGMILPSVPKGYGQSGPSVAAMWGGSGAGPQSITVTLSLVGTDTAMGTVVHKLVREGYAQLRAVDSNGNSLPVKVA